ncbi:MAG: 3-dehydroquinate synthase [Clostridiales bacterium]|nr:3-dehydroquinate synthase [Clostridiales bacterium]
MSVVVRITVEASSNYDVLIAEGLLGETGSLAAEVVPPCKVLVASDDIVTALYSDTVVHSLQDAGFEVEQFTFPHGEKSKNLQTLNSLLEYAAKKQLTRQSLFVALGGGITGDLTGFAAAVYQRGAGYIQIPTTFLAAIDSSVGGKTAVNLDAGKNLAGAFFQPRLVICDLATFETLPSEVFSDGAAEAVKYGMISDYELFLKLEAGITISNLQDIVARCVDIKRQIVARDEYDRGERQLLNYGHTFGHGIEKCSGYTISHGHAVAIGMVMAARAAERLGIAEEECSDRLAAALHKYGLPVYSPFETNELTSAILTDKKRAGDTLTVVLPERPGRCILHKLPVDDIERLVSLSLE